jgi:hypothetical protein
MPSETAFMEVIEQLPLLFLDTEELLHSLSLLYHKLLERHSQYSHLFVKIFESTYLECLDP